jgi:hypothetical protein
MKPPGYYIRGPRKSLKHFKLSAETRAVLDGCLLGDGSYNRRSAHTASFSMSQLSRHQDWINLIKTTFDRYGIGYGSHYHRSDDPRIQDSLRIWSYSYVELSPERDRWYPDGVKIIPSDLSVKDTRTLAHWHMGDGNASTPRGRLEVKLHTNGFLESDVELLVAKLHDQIQIHSFISHWRNQPILVLQHKNAAKFLDLVRPHLVDSFLYKAPFDPWKPSRCRKCKKELGAQKYAKYCDSCASPAMKRFRALSQEQREKINLQKKLTRWAREAKGRGRGLWPRGRGGRTPR